MKIERSSTISFQQIQDMLERALGATPQPFHIAFWRGLNREEMVAKKLLGKQLIVPGSPDQSHLLLALRDSPGGPLRAFFVNSVATRDDIELLEGWIREGCPELPMVPKANLMGAMDAGTADERHIEYWRAIDHFFQPSLASQETLPHVIRMHGDALEAWLPTMLSNDPNAWPDYLARPEIAESFAYVRHHQRRLLLEYYSGSQEGIFDSLWKFGGSLLPVDPQHPLPPLVDHRMNSVLDWFFWAPYLDATLRANDVEDIDVDLARGWQLGIVADGLLRKDSERPVNARMPIPDFDPNDAALRGSVEARYAGAAGPDLIEEMVRRTIESKLFT